MSIKVPKIHFDAGAFKMSSSIVFVMFKCSDVSVCLKVHHILSLKQCISGVFGWDFNLITSKCFVTCVRQLNTMCLFFI